MPPKARVSKTSSRGKPQASKKAPPTAASLIEQGNLALSRLEPELAAKFFTAALKLSPQDTNIMDALADVQIQLGDSDGALELLTMSTQLAPSENPVKWLYLAQLREGQDALECYRTAIRLIEKAAETETETETEMETRQASKDLARKQIARAYCSIAELYLTDLCYDDGAEASCEAAVQEALRQDSTNLEIYQTLASLRISQCRGQEASELMQRVAQKVLEVREKLHRRTLAEDLGVATQRQHEEDHQADELDAPTVEAATATVKLCLECVVYNPALAEAARALITNLLEEDDEVIELWRLLGLACQQLQPTPDLQGAVDAFEQAKDLLEQIREQIRQEELETGIDMGSSSSSSSSSAMIPGEASTSEKATGEEAEDSCCCDEDGKELTEYEFYDRQYQAVVQELATLAANPALLQQQQQQAGVVTTTTTPLAAFTPLAVAAAVEKEEEEWSTEEEEEMET